MKTNAAGKKPPRIDRRVRIRALKATAELFCATEGILASERESLSRAIALLKANDVNRGRPAYSALSMGAQTEFWRSLTFYQLTRLEKLPVERHAGFWWDLALTATRQLDAAGAEGNDLNVIQLFPRGR